MTPQFTKTSLTTQSNKVKYNNKLPQQQQQQHIMSFILNLFSDNSTPAERENAAQLKVLIDERKAEYKQIKPQAKDELQQQIQSAINREMDVITTSEAFVGSDERTKGKVESGRSWLASSASEQGHCGREGHNGGHGHGKRQELDEKNRTLNQDGEGVLPGYSSFVDTKEQ